MFWVVGAYCVFYGVISVAFFVFASFYERKLNRKQGKSKEATGVLDLIAAVVVSLVWPATCTVAVTWWLASKWLRWVNCRG